VTVFWIALLVAGVLIAAALFALRKSPQPRRPTTQFALPVPNVRNTRKPDWVVRE